MRGQLLLFAALARYVAGTAAAGSAASPGDNSTKPAASNVYIGEYQTSIAINLPPNSTDINFRIKSQTWYSYIGVGIGSAMANSLMLVAYAAGDNQHITVSPRLATGDSEPPYYPAAIVELDPSSAIQDTNFVVSGTCKGCRSWPGGLLDVHATAQPFIFALGPNLPLTSNDPAIGLRRHIAYGHFTMSMTHATGPGGVEGLAAVDGYVTSGARLSTDVTDDVDRGALAHGVIMILTALALAPLDLLAASLRRWPVVHAVTATVYAIAMLGGFVVGIKISGEYLTTQKFATAHQALGFVAMGVLVVLLIMGTMQALRMKAAKKRGEEARTGIVGFVHGWIGRLLWLVMLVNCGLGLKLATARTTFFIGYAVLAAGVFIITVLILLCLHCCIGRKERRRKRAEDDSTHQLANLYAHQ